MSSPDCLKSDGVFVFSCDNLPPQNVILQILGKDNLPDAADYSDIKAYLWNIDTKYYSADVYLYAVEQKKELASELTKTIKALIFHFDGAKPSSFENVKSWMPYLKDIDAEVQLLICDEIKETDERKCILNWCVENQYELVELNSSSECDEENESHIKDAKGYARVIESLQSHTWANLVMKGAKMKSKSGEQKKLTDSSKKDEKLNPSKEEKGACKKEPAKKSKTEYVEDEDLLNEAREGTLEILAEMSHPWAKIWMEEISGKPSDAAENGACSSDSAKDSEIDGVKELEEKLMQDVLNGECTETLEGFLAKVACLKAKVPHLSDEERKKNAEEVALEFWRVLGGSDSEIEGLDDDDDDDEDDD